MTRSATWGLVVTVGVVVRLGVAGCRSMHTVSIERACVCARHFVVLGFLCTRAADMADVRQSVAGSAVGGGAPCEWRYHGGRPRAWCAWRRRTPRCHCFVGLVKERWKQRLFELTRSVARTGGGGWGMGSCSWSV